MTRILNPHDEHSMGSRTTCSHAADDRVMLFVPVDGLPLDVAADGEACACRRGSICGHGLLPTALQALSSGVDDYAHDR
jgi:hypothetical protein